jgi:hypothetical protein
MSALAVLAALGPLTGPLAAACGVRARAAGLAGACGSPRAWTR